MMILNFRPSALFLCVFFLLGMQLSFASSQEDSAHDLEEKAFNVALEKVFPLSPEQIQQIFAAYDEKLAITSFEPKGVPQPVTSTQLINLSPGAPIPLIRLAKGYITSVIFLDQTGQPWPIANYSLGNPDSFDIVWDNQSNTLFIQAMKRWALANIGIRLQGLATPIMMNLSSNQGEIDYRVDLTIPDKGPNAKETYTLNNRAELIDTQLLAYLAANPPAYAQSLVVDPVYAQAWSEGPYIFIRTKDTLLSPAWLSTTMSSDGTKVYKLERVNSIVISRQGSPKTLSIKGL